MIPVKKYHASPSEAAAAMPSTKTPTANGMRSRSWVSSTLSIVPPLPRKRKPEMVDNDALTQTFFFRYRPACFAVAASARGWAAPGRVTQRHITLLRRRAARMDRRSGSGTQPKPLHQIGNPLGQCDQTDPQRQ